MTSLLCPIAVNERLWLYLAGRPPPDQSLLAYSLVRKVDLYLSLMPTTRTPLEIFYLQFHTYEQVYYTEISPPPLHYWRRSPTAKSTAAVCFWTKERSLWNAVCSTFSSSTAAPRSNTKLNAQQPPQTARVQILLIHWTRKETQRKERATKFPITTFKFLIEITSKFYKTFNFPMLYLTSFPTLSHFLKIIVKIRKVRRLCANLSCQHSTWLSCWQCSNPPWTAI